MRNIFNYVSGIIGVLIAAILIAGGTSLPAIAGSVISGCSVEVVKITDVETSQLFDFVADTISDPNFNFSLESGESQMLVFGFEEELIISEIVPDGWALQNVICDDGVGGVNILIEADGTVVAFCNELGSTTCEFTNVMTERNIPTLSEWGMIAAAAGLALIGVFFAVRRKRLNAEV